jgi:thiol-disulfide isomerase/thioredoxin
LRGKVVLIDFWAYSCVNCIRTQPYLNAWYSKYKDSGLVIIGVHTPEFDFEKVYDNVLFATKKYNITYPVALDNDYGTWTAYQNQYWPRKYLIDKDGSIRYDHIGEGGYEETEMQIQQLLAEAGNNMSQSNLVDITDTTPTTQNTPELYVGYDFALPRGEDIGNSGGMKKDVVTNYVVLQKRNPDTVYIEGSWLSNPDNLMAKTNNTDAIYLGFTAKNANIVASSNSTAEVEVLIDGKDITSDVAGSDVTIKDGKAYMRVDEPRLYNIYDGPYGSHELKLVVNTDGFLFNSFTFG